MKITDIWSVDALNLFEKLVSTASNIFFKKSDDIRDEEMSFGELIVEKDDKEFNVGTELVRLKLAVQVSAEKFLRAFNATTASVTERWNDNSRLGGVLNTPDFIETGEVASKGFKDHPFLFQYLEKRVEQSLVSAELEVINSFSVSKVSQWLEKNSKVENIVFEANAIDIDKLMLNEARPTSLVSPTNRSQSSKPSQSISDSQRTSSQESEVPSAAEKASQDDDLSFDSFMKKRRFEKTGDVSVGGILEFMKRK